MNGLLSGGLTNAFYFMFVSDPESEFKFRLVRGNLFENIASAEKPHVRNKHDPNYRYEGRTFEPNFGLT
jgi:hypothetical protein